MPTFHYVAKPLFGAPLSGQLTVETRRDALSWLAQQSLFPVTLEAAAGTSLMQRRGRPNAAALTAMFDSLTDLLESGVPLLKAMDILIDQTAHPTLRDILRTIRQQIADGRPLAEAMRDHPQAFSSLAISMVHAGEEGGFLEGSLRRIAKFTERSEELRGRVVSALAYPAFLLATGLVVLIGMLVFFVPKFEPLFGRLRANGTLPWATTLLLTISDLFREQLPWVLAFVVVAGLGAKWLSARDSFRSWWDSVQLTLPLWGPIARHLAIARFSRVLGTLLQNGVPMLRSLGIAKDAAGNRVLCAAIADAAENISSGKTLAQPLRASGQFPREVLEILSVAEQANRLETVLVELAEKLEQKAHRRLDVLMKLLEPCLMLLMALMVGFLVVALLLPVFEGSSGL